MHTSVSILKLEPSDPTWASFLDTQVDINIFYHPAWMQLLKECYGYRPFILALTESTGGLIAGVPLMEVANPITGKRWVSLPFSDYCRPLSKDEAFLSDFAEQILRLAKNQKIHALELRGVYSQESSLLSYSNHVVHKLGLETGVEGTWKNIHAMHRRNVRIAMDNNVEIIFGTQIEHLVEFYRLHLLTRHRQGVPVQPWRFFALLKKLLLDQGSGFLLLAYKKQQCIAGALFLHWKDTFTYKYGASTEDSLCYRPNNLIMWTAIRHACEHGFKYFDMGRTDIENNGLRIFKTRWGAIETPLFYSSTNLPRSTSGWSRHIHFFIQKSPVWACRLSGELLYKYFG
jgi:CelD/BcsL family acetyltransferase involved in cellulose biosynthesis